MDEITLHQIRAVLTSDEAGLTEFEQTLIQWYFLMDQSRPTMVGLREYVNIEKLDRSAVEKSLGKALAKLKAHLAKHKITSMRDVVY